MKLYCFPWLFFFFSTFEDASQCKMVAVGLLVCHAGSNFRPKACSWMRDEISTWQQRILKSPDEPEMTKTQDWSPFTVEVHETIGGSIFSWSASSAAQFLGSWSNMTEFLIKKGISLHFTNLCQCWNSFWDTLTCLLLPCSSDLIKRQATFQKALLFYTCFAPFWGCFAHSEFCAVEKEEIAWEHDGKQEWQMHAK